MIIEVPDLTPQECGDIAITAAEGGIGYWSQIETYRPSRWCGPDLTDPERVPDDFVFYTIRTLTSDEGDYNDPYDITPALIRLGFEKAMSAPGDKGGWAVHGLLDVAREDWTGEIDSDAADIILQYGCFGEIIYG